MSHVTNTYKKELGYKGESFIIDKLKTSGFYLHKRNIKYINSEIDVVVYRYNTLKNTLDIRIIEVKTRSSYEFDLVKFNLPKKWMLIRRYMFKIKEEIDGGFDNLKYSSVHFDLALVRSFRADLSLYSYIKDVNLIL